MNLSLFVLAFFFFHSIYADVPTYDELYFEQNVDHYNYYSTPQTYQQRYLVNSSFWDPQQGSIFIYCGNEGNIESFWQNSGFLFELAPSFGAYVVFAEHRYYGESWPFPEETAFINGHNGYLTTEQALADFATLLNYVQQDLLSQQKKRGSAPFELERYPVFAFGGSYGGMLAGWIRLRYPYIVDAALASSAPIPMASLPEERASNAYWELITDVYGEMSAQCPDLVRQGFSQILDTAEEDGGYKTLSQQFSLCTPLESDDDVEQLTLWLTNAFSSLAMANYPYSTGFLGSLPAWPLNVSCDLMLDNQHNPVDGLVAVANLFYNDSTLTCFPIYAQYVQCADATGCGSGFEGKSWDYQACSEMIYYPATTNVTDMFPPHDWNSELHGIYCSDTWSIESRLDWTALSLGGSAKDFQATSRIIFSNGMLDPWSSGGFKDDISDSIPVIIISGAAHHLDLRSSNDADPVAVTQARQQEFEILSDWFEEIKQELTKKQSR